MAVELRKPDSSLGTWPEESTRLITATVQDENGDAIPGSALTSITMTLYSEHDQAIINSRDDVDISSSVSEAGVLSLVLTADDMAIQDDDLLEERHRLLIEWEYNSGRKGRHEMQIVVSNMAKVP